MTRTTTSDIEQIINGKPLPILLPYPLDGQEDREWFIEQPKDWLLDLADAVYRAAYAQAMTLPGMAEAQKLPPSEEWSSRQLEAIAVARKRIEELTAIAERTPEDDLELFAVQEQEASYIRPEQHSLAKEIAHDTATKARRHWLLPRLIVDKDRKLLFDPDTEAGRVLWDRLGRETKDGLSLWLGTVLLLVEKAKNFNAGQSSDSK